MSGHFVQRDIGAKKLGWTILLNLGITAAEAVGGLLSGSLALVSDAGHNLSDVFALILAYVGARGAVMRPTKRSTYGFKRLEVFTAVINAVSLVIIALYIIWEAFRRYAEPQEIDGLLMLSVAAVGLLGNLLSVWILHRDRQATINSRAAFLHMLYDAISSVAVIIGGIVIIISGWYLLDLILSVLIAMMILWSSLDILKEAAGIFMESVPRGVDIDRVGRSIAVVPGVKDVHHLHIWSLSSSQAALSCHIILDEGDYQRFPEIVRDVTLMLQKTYGIDHATIQPEGPLCPEQPVQSRLPHRDGDTR